MNDDKKEKKQFEYLFLDIEWNQAPGTNGLDGREAIQIGVLAADEAMQKVKIFSKGIRLSDPKKRYEKIQNSDEKTQSSSFTRYIECHCR